MKKILFLAISATALLNSCSRDNGEDENSSTQAITTQNLQGKWYIDKETVVFAESTKANETILYNDDCTKKSNWLFEDDNVYVFQYYYTNSKGDCAFFENEGDWKLNGNKLALKELVTSNYTEDYEYTITSMKDNKMTVEYTEDYDENGTEDKIIVELHK